MDVEKIINISVLVIGFALGILFGISIGESKIFTCLDQYSERECRIRYGYLK
jgi:hypothetical protein